MRILALITSAVFAFAALANPVHQDPVFFDNQSDDTIYLLPETGGPAVVVPPGTRIWQPMDAWTDPQISRQDPSRSVFKVVDNISVTLSHDRRVFTSGGSLEERVGQALEGGWKDLSWVHANPYFAEFFDHVP